MKLFSVLNLSEESSQTDTICYSPAETVVKLQHLLGLGADFIDIGSRSSSSKSIMIDDVTEQSRLNPFFHLAEQQSIRKLSLDTWSEQTALKYLKYIDVLNYTSTQFSDKLLSALAHSNVKIIINYLPAINPYDLRSHAREDFNINQAMDYFSHTIRLLISRGVDVLAIDPNLGMWHPSVDRSEKTELQQKIIEQIPRLKTLAPVFIIAPRTNKKLNIKLTKCIISQEVDFIRTHDLKAVLDLIKR